MVFLKAVYLEEKTMKNILLTSVAVLFVGTSATFAAMPVIDLDTVASTAQQHDFMQLAKDGDDDRGGDDNSGRGSDDNDGDDDDSSDDRGGDRNRSSSDDSGSDDRGGDRNRSSNDNANDDSTQSNSNRSKPRIPGGSGCDDAGDIAEHAECRVQ
jgi:hypothetical protein